MISLGDTVRPGSGQYYAESGALSILEDKLKSFKKPVVLTGKKSWEVFTKHYKGAIGWPVYHYDGEASRESAQALGPAFRKEGADLVLAIGGGKCLDTGKLLAEYINIEFATIPTLISNCAGITPITATYKPNHEFVRVDYQPRAAFFCLVDYDMLLDVPEEYFVAGIGDTLAKWYEADAIIRATKEELPASAKLGLASSKVVGEILTKYSKDALKALREKKVNYAFKQVTDAIIGLAGTVGGFGTHYTRMAGAHSLQNGMTLAPETHTALHGAKVAYGILVQLVITGQIDEIKRLIPMYRSIGLPTHLADLHIVDDVDAKLKKITEFAVKPEEQYILVKPDITAREVQDAVHTVEKISAEM